MGRTKTTILLTHLPSWRSRTLLSGCEESFVPFRAVQIKDGATKLDNYLSIKSIPSLGTLVYILSSDPTLKAIPISLYDSRLLQHRHETDHYHACCVAVLSPHSVVVAVVVWRAAFLSLVLPVESLVVDHPE
jgi:hypothetical protein